MLKLHIKLIIISLFALAVFVPTGFTYAAGLDEFCEFDEDCGGYICDLNVDVDEDGENDAGLCRECQGGGSYESGNGFGCYEEDGEVCATSGADKGKCVPKGKQVTNNDDQDQDSQATDDGRASGSATGSGIKGATQYDGKTFSFFGLVQGDNLGELIVSVYEDLAFKLIGIIIFVRLLIVSFNYISGQFGGAKIGGVGSIGEEVANAVLALIILTSAYVVLNTINPDLVEGKFSLEAISGSQVPGSNGQTGGGSTGGGGGSGNDKPGEGVCSPLQRDCFGGCTQYKAFADKGAGGIVKSSWLTAIVIQESSCGKSKGPNPRSGACGVGQFLKGTAAEYISKAIKNSKCGITKQDQTEFTASYCDWLKKNDEKSVCMSGLYLNELGRICKTDLFQNIAAAYNWGPGNACNAGGAKKGKCTGQSACDSNKPAEPWECKGPTETKNYVRQTLFCSTSS